MKETTVADGHRRFLQLLSELGFDVVAPLPGDYRILVPRGLELVGLTPSPDGEPGIPTQLQPVEGADYLYWNGYEEVFIDPAEATRCFWAFVELGVSEPEAIGDFVRRWGLYQFAGQPDEEGWASVASLTKEVARARAFLIAIAATEAGDVIPDELLESLDVADATYDSGVFGGGRTHYGLVLTHHDPAAELLEASQRRERRRRAKLGGTSLELQRNLVASFLDEKFFPAQGWATWDSTGRRYERVETAVENIVWSHLYALFTASRIDVYVCAICGRPYEFDEAASERRPRSGVRRLCSEVCRLEAKRISNRESWQKNAKRWRPPKGKGQDRGTQG